MHLNPESLSFALLISDLGSIARAANILGMKQATLSRKLTALESRVGVRLFDRSTRGAVPTVSGAGFLNQARRIVAGLDTLLTSSRAAASDEEGKLGIGFSTSLAAGGMRALILELIQTLPGVQLSGFERGRRRLSQALNAGTIDFAVLSGDLVLETSSTQNSRGSRGFQCSERSVRR
jgi:DNA-binding transcriptional LysR family regulator